MRPPEPQPRPQLINWMYRLRRHSCGRRARLQRHPASDVHEVDRGVSLRVETSGDMARTDHVSTSHKRSIAPGLVHWATLRRMKRGASCSKLKTLPGARVTPWVMFGTERVARHARDALRAKIERFEAFVSREQSVANPFSYMATITALGGGRRPRRHLTVGNSPRLAGIILWPSIPRSPLTICG